MLSSLSDTLLDIGIALGLLLAVSVGAVALQIGLKYTKPNIGYQVRNHRHRIYTFFVRNFDSVHYTRSLHLIVSGIGLKYVGVRAGPWSQHKPVKLDTNDDRVRVLVKLDEVPEDAAFAIQAICTGDKPRIAIAPDSPLQSRAFKAPPAKFTVIAKFRYYLLRYAIGIAGFSVIFLGGLTFDHQRIEGADLVATFVVAIVGFLSFMLVVPTSGKRTIVGYLTTLDVEQYWGDRAGSGGEGVSATD